jgi:hypothetical protein
MIAIFPDEYDLMLNNLRLLSKISLSESCCAIMMENPICMKHIVSFFTLYKSNTYIIIRTAFLLAYTFHLVIYPVFFHRSVNKFILSYKNFKQYLMYFFFIWRLSKINLNKQVFLLNKNLAKKVLDRVLLHGITRLYRRNHHKML